MTETPISTEAPPPKRSTTKFLVCVNDTPEAMAALRFACIKVKKSGGLVDILHVMTPEELQPLFGLNEKIRDEKREVADALLKRMADEAYKLTGLTPNLLLREGKLGPEIVAAALEDYEVSMLVLGLSATSPNGHKLVSWLAPQLGDKLLIPVMLVPGNLTDQQIEELS